MNQGYLRERSRAVRRMRLIYDIAADVVKQLRSEGEETYKDLDLIRILSYSCTDGTDKALGVKLRRYPVTMSLVLG